jgi:AcrR family transcriptional regulator
MAKGRNQVRNAALWDDVAELKRERILQASVDLFYSNGYLPTTMDDIAESLGVTKPFVYYHFKGKVDLLSEIARRATNEWLGVTMRAIELPLPPTEMLSQIVREFAMIVMNMYKHVSIFFREQLNLPKAVADEISNMRRKIDAHVRAILTAGKDSGVFVFGDPAVASQIVTGMISYVFAWYREPSRLSKEEICDQMVEHVLRSVGAQVTRT